MNESVRSGAFVALVTLLTTAGAQAQGGAEAVWTSSKMFVPAALTASAKPCGGDIARCSADLKPGKHPVILFMHGCGGAREPKAFFGLNAIVVAPDSFAEKGLKQKCVPGTPALADVVKARVEHLKYATSQLRSASWADANKLILAGFSNGGQMAATWPGSDYKARVIVAWPCQSAIPGLVGVKGSGPVLAVLGGADPVYAKSKTKGDCGEFIAQRAQSKNLIIKGGDHEILDHAETRKAIAEFIPAVLQ